MAPDLPVAARQTVDQSGENFGPGPIRTPDQRLRVFVSSTLGELAEERQAAQAAVAQLRLSPVLFELGARPHPPHALYRAYLAQSDVFVGLYWQRYGWVAPGEAVSGLEDEYALAAGKPKLIYVKGPAPQREPRLAALLERVKQDDAASYQHFQSPQQLQELLANDLALLLTERFDRPTPAASASTAPSTNIPVIRDVLVDRVQESAMAQELLQRPEVSLLTLTGPGGTGKTRLAFHIATQLQSGFADGVNWVSLAAIREPRLVASTIAQTLNVQESHDRTAVDSLTESLRHQQRLLLLDNFEQVIEAAPLVVELLDRCPRLKVLVTSRMPLHVQGEKELPIPPLALPSRDRAAEADEIAHYGALELFVRRAREGRPDFTLTADTTEVVAEICRRLDGLPLAIELAAARTKVLSPRALLARLDHRIPVLTAGPRDLPARQQTLRDTIAWSYDLLEEEEKTLFRRLAVFVDGCTLEAAEAVVGVGGTASLDVLDGITLLVDKSLLFPVDGVGSEPRFRMLATIREFAWEQLERTSEAAALRRRHADYFTTLVETAEPHLKSAVRQERLLHLEQEHNNLRAALEWSLSADGDTSLGMRLAGALAWFFYLRGYVSEGRDWMERTLERSDSAERTFDRAKVLFGAGAAAWIQADLAVANVRLEESLAILRELDEQCWIAYALTVTALAATSGGNLAGALALYTESLAIAREVGDHWWEAFTLQSMGDATLLSGDYVAARATYEASLAVYEQIGDQWGRSLPLNALGSVAAALGDYDKARSRYEESLTLLRMTADKRAIALTLANLAGATLHQGDNARAKDLFRESLPLWREVGFPPGILVCLTGLALVATGVGQSERAVRLLGAAPALSTAAGTIRHAIAAADIENAVTQLHTQFDPDSYAVAWAAGQAMTTDQAIAYALDEPA